MRAFVPAIMHRWGDGLKEQHAVQHALAAIVHVHLASYYYASSGPTGGCPAQDPSGVAVASRVGRASASPSSSASEARARAQHNSGCISVSSHTSLAIKPGLGMLLFGVDGVDSSVACRTGVPPSDTFAGTIGSMWCWTAGTGAPTTAALVSPAVGGVALRVVSTAMVVLAAR